MDHLSSIFTTFLSSFTGSCGSTLDLFGRPTQDFAIYYRLNEPILLLLLVCNETNWFLITPLYGSCFDQSTSTLMSLDTYSRYSCDKKGYSSQPKNVLVGQFLLYYNRLVE